LDYPRDWKVLSPSDLKRRSDQMNVRQEDDRRVLVVQNPSDRDVLETIQVEVYDGSTPITEHAAGVLWERLLNSYGSIGLNPKLRRLELEQIGINSGISVEFDLRLAADLPSIRYWYFWTSTSNQVFSLSFAAEGSIFETYRDQFIIVARSFHIQPVVQADRASRRFASTTILIVLVAIAIGLYWGRRPRTDSGSP
jgi:hypothetical protein